MYTQQFKTRCQRYAFYITGVGKPIELSDNIRWPKGQRQNGKGLQCACHRVDGQKKGNSVTSCVCSWNPCLIAKNNWFTIYIFISLCVVYLRTWMIWFTVNSPAWNNFSRALSCYRTTRHMNPPPQAIAGTAPKMCLPPLLNLESSMGAPGNGVPHQPQAQKRYIPQLFSNINMKGNGHPFYFRIFHDFPWNQPALGPFSVARSGKGVKLRSQAMHKGNLLRTVATIRRPYITVVALINGP